MAKTLTDVMVKLENSEAFRETVWVLIEELHTDGWQIAGRPFAGPESREQAEFVKQAMIGRGIALNSAVLR